MADYSSGLDLFRLIFCITTDLLKMTDPPLPLVLLLLIKGLVYMYAGVEGSPEATVKSYPPTLEFLCLLGEEGT